MLRKLCIACFLLCVLDWESSYAVGITKQEREQQILKQLIDEDRYDKRVRPSGDKNNESGPTVVSINLFIRSIEFIDEANMEYGVQMTFRQQWWDSRLAYNKTANGLQYLILTEMAQIWIPDLFFSNEKTSHMHELMVPNHYIRIFPEGDVLYSSRITMKLSCPMDMRLFPFDEQSCQLRMASYGYTTDDIIFKFKETEPIQFSELHLPKFSMKTFNTANCDSVTNTGAYSCLRVDLLFAREFSPYLISTYIPSTTVVIVAWLSCWLDQNSVTARILIGLSTQFVLAMQFSELNASLPTTGYTKAIDVWAGMCNTFVFACLVEFIIVNCLARSETGEDKEPQENNEEIPLNQKDLEIEVQEPKKNIKTAAQNWVAGFPSKSRKLDAIFRIAYPIAFAFFVLIYFIAY